MFVTFKAARSLSSAGVSLVAALAAAALATSVQAQVQPPALVPAPAAMTVSPGAFRLDETTVLSIPEGDAKARAAAVYLADLLERTRGLSLAVIEGDPAPGVLAVRFTRSGPAAPEGYGLATGPGGAVITADDAGGLLYGAVALWQLAMPGPGPGHGDGTGPIDLPVVTIQDAPRFAWRGLMIDSGRHMQSIETIKAVIDAMTVHKLNVLHWHLVEDQGWRLEILKYPRLTEVGAWRVPAGAAGRDPDTGEPVVYGGFYTQDEVREVVAYAAARNITVVPEIEMPGHALSALVAYPEFGVTGEAPAELMGDWGVFPYLYNVEDETFGFLTDVLDEVMDLFPSTFIHIGGDEAVKDQWKASPHIQARIRELGLADEDELQSWFIRRIEQHLNVNGRRLIGWDEILEGGLAPNATVMSWRGIDGAIHAARLGHDTVLSPAPDLYLDHRQSASPDEPPGRGQPMTLKRVYEFDPAPAALTPEQRGHILGLQANVWTEHIRTDERFQAMAFPRIIALAERGWSPADRTDWDDFARRTPAVLARLDALGVGYNTIPFEPVIDLTEQGDATLEARIAPSLPMGEARYTLDGTEPTAASPAYEAPLSVPEGTLIRARTFIDGAPLGRVREVSAVPAVARTRASQQLDLCTGGLVLQLEDDGVSADGSRAVFNVDIMNPCWLWRSADLSGGARITARVGQLPFNFQIGAARDNIRLHTPLTPAGELLVRQGCDGEILAALSVETAVGEAGVSALVGDLPAREGVHDLCFVFTSHALDPYWVIDRITLDPVGPASRQGF